VRFSHRTSTAKICFAIKAPCVSIAGCQTRFRVVPDVRSDYIEIARAMQRDLCAIKTDRTALTGAHRDNQALSLSAMSLPCLLLPPPNHFTRPPRFS
jgi:hypothetical protein